MVDMDRFDNFRQGILDTINGAYEPGRGAGWVGYAEGHDYAMSPGFEPDSDYDRGAYAVYFGEEGD